jgi:hypothetical protein
VGELIGLGSARGMARQMLRQSAKRASGFVLWKRILRRSQILFRILFEDDNLLEKCQKVLKTGFLWILQRVMDGRS